MQASRGGAMRGALVEERGWGRAGGGGSFAGGRGGGGEGGGGGGAAAGAAARLPMAQARGI